ncbi:hypothetical protein Pla163_09260 [Planctomycetes bacterium Pla163]|uniref:HlyD family secretion protein n=1 Tax=Rohdeia mirabilis TaxID=2528008 RepID=A0A518CX73_9BACT|nr:hypothetical protein Pla163_09260 [Planctomycetes bacterium Pla163]
MRTPLRQWFTDLRGGPLAAFAFLGAAVALWWMVMHQAPARTFVAIVRGDEVILRAPADQLVDQVFARAYEHVESGDVLCTFDGARLEADLAVARAEAFALEAEVGAESARIEAERRRLAFDALDRDERLVRERATDLRRLELDVEELRLDALSATVELAALEVDRRRYEVRLQYLAELLEPGLTPRSEAAEIEARLAAIADEVARREEQLTGLERARERAEERLELLRDSKIESTAALLPADEPSLLEPLRRRIDVQTALAARLALAADDLVLRAPVSGRIDSVLAHPGRRTVADEGLVTLVAPSRSSTGRHQADLFLREDQTGALVVGDRLELGGVDVLAPDGAPITIEGEVVAAAPRLVELPQRLWLDPRVPEHGHSFLIALPAGTTAVPGARLWARLVP